MKLKIVLSIVIVGFCTYAVKAQTSQGSILAGGNVSLGFEKDKSKFDGTTVDGDSHTDISFAPLFGYFFADGMVAGAGLDISTSVTESDDGSSKQTDNSLGIMPFFRYYHDSGLFGHASVTIGSGKSKNESGGTTNEFKFNTFRWEVGPGYAIFLNENVAAEALLTYGSTTTSDKDSDAKLTRSGLLINIGFTVFIN